MAYGIEFVVCFAASGIGVLGSLRSLANLKSKKNENQLCKLTLLTVLGYLIVFSICTVIEKGRLYSTETLPQEPLELFIAGLGLFCYYGVLISTAFLACYSYSAVRSPGGQPSRFNKYAPRIIVAVSLVLLASGATSFRDLFIAGQLGNESSLASQASAFRIKYTPAILFVPITLLLSAHTINFKSFKDGARSAKRFAVYARYIGGFLSPILLNGIIVLFVGKPSSILAVLECCVPLLASLPIERFSSIKTESEEITQEKLDAFNQIPDAELYDGSDSESEPQTNLQEGELKSSQNIQGTQTETVEESAPLKADTSHDFSSS